MRKGANNNLKYNVLQNLNFVLFDKKWSAKQELLLFEGLAKFGFGNWRMIAEHIGGKSAAETKKHYRDVFLNKD